MLKNLKVYVPEIADNWTNASFILARINEQDVTKVKKISSTLPLRGKNSVLYLAKHLRKKFWPRLKDLAELLRIYDFDFFLRKKCQIRGGSRRVAKFLRESILIAFDFIWKVVLSDRSFATLLDPPMQILRKFFSQKSLQIKDQY